MCGDLSKFGTFSLMNLRDKYEAIFTQAKSKLKTDISYWDSLIDDANDNRYGITLLIRPNELVKAKIAEVLLDFKGIEPNQYYYPNTDIHITGLSIISCYPAFDLSSINVEDYIQVVEQSLKNINPFSLTFNGLTASADCVMVKGYYAPNTLDLLRRQLRDNFSHSKLQQSLDQRYTLETAHATILRLRSELKDTDTYIQRIEKYKDFDFGSCLVDQVELVYNDWYQKASKVVKLGQFNLENT